MPLVLIGFGAGALVGFLVGGQVGDRHPHATTVGAAAATAVTLLLICLLSTFVVPMVLLAAVLGFFGLGANPVLIALAVHFAKGAPTLGSALTVSGFNLGTAVGSSIAGIALDSRLGVSGPAEIGTAIACLTLMPTVCLLRMKPVRRGSGLP